MRRLLALLGTALGLGTLSLVLLSQDIEPWQVGGLAAAFALTLLAVWLLYTARGEAGKSTLEDVVEAGEHWHGRPEEDESRRLRRRSLLLGLGAVAAMLTGVGILLGLAPPPLEARATAWREGRRLVDPEGRPIHLDDVEVGSFAVAYPEGHIGAADAQVMLVRLLPGRDVLEPALVDWTVEGYVAYSRICTHQGCVISLYEQESNILVCPCHFASFDVLRGALPIFGPAPRALPQLPLGLDDSGFLIALGDFPAPVGPAPWVTA